MLDLCLISNPDGVAAQFVDPFVENTEKFKEKEEDRCSQSAVGGCHTVPAVYGVWDAKSWYCVCDRPLVFQCFVDFDFGPVQKGGEHMDVPVVLASPGLPVQRLFGGQCSLS